VDPSIKFLLEAKRWIEIALFPVGLVYGQWTVIQGIADKLPFSIAMLVGLAAMAAVTALLYFVLKLIDRSLDHRPAAKQARSVARVLEGMKIAGLSTVTNQQIVNAWFEVQPPTNETLRVAIKTGLYGRLWRANEQGLIRAALPVNRNEIYPCNIDDAIRVFRGEQWMAIFGESASQA
jgi:hypothetical protein